MEGTTPEMVSFMHILKQNRSKLSAQQKGYAYINMQYNIQLN